MTISLEIRQKIIETRNKLGWSQQDLADAAKTSQQQVQRIEAGKIKKISNDLPAILRALNLNDITIETPIARGHRPSLVSSNQLVGDRDFPIHTAAEGGEGALIVSHEAIEWVKRPGPLIGVKDGYGLYVIGESMAPRYEPGDVLLVHPHLPPRAGAHVVLYKIEDGTDYAMVKKLVKVTHTEWHLEQYNPPPGEARTFVLPKADWNVCHVIVGSYEKR